MEQTHWIICTELNGSEGEVWRTFIPSTQGDVDRVMDAVGDLDEWNDGHIDDGYFSIQIRDVNDVSRETIAWLVKEENHTSYAHAYALISDDAKDASIDQLLSVIEDDDTYFATMKIREA